MIKKHEKKIGYTLLAKSLTNILWMRGKKRCKKKKRKGK